VGKEIKRITKLFEEAPIKTAFKAQNTMQNIIKPHSQRDRQKKVAYTK
jgi:hypothetical protein